MPSTCGTLISLFIYYVVIFSYLPTIVGNLIDGENKGFLDVTIHGVYGKEERIEVMGIRAKNTVEK